MKNIRTKVLSAFALLLAFGSIAQQTQNREAAKFTELDVSGAIEVVYTHTDSLFMKVEGRAEDLERLETRLEGDKLKIWTTKSHESIRVYLGNSAMNKVTVHGASELKSTNQIKADKLAVSASGASSVKADVQVNTLDIDCTGASMVKLTGTANQLNGEFSGASSFKGYDLTVQDATVTATGASNAKINVNGNVKVTATGASDVRMKGDAKNVDAHSGGASSISRVRADAGGNSGRDTVEYRVNNKKVIVINEDDDHEKQKKRRVSSRNFAHWAGFMVGINGYMTPSGGALMPKTQSFLDLNYAKSLNLQLNFFEVGFRIVKNHVRLITGLGIDHHQYSFLRNTTLIADTSFTWGDVNNNPDDNWKKNKLRVTYLQVPLLFDFNTRNTPRKSFHMAVGVVGEVLIGSRTRQTIETGGLEMQLTRKDDFNLNPFMAKAHVNIGYGAFTLFAEYGLTHLFSPGAGPQLNPFGVGVRVIPFGG